MTIHHALWDFTHETLFKLPLSVQTEEEARILMGYLRLLIHNEEGIDNIRYQELKN